MRLAWPCMLVALVCVIGADASTAYPTAQKAARATSGDAIAGWVFVAPDARVEGARIHVLTFGGRDLTVGGAWTGTNGTFVVHTRALPQRVIVEAAGGKVDGLPLPITMRSVVTRPHSHALQYVNPATSVAERYAVDHPTTAYADVVRKVKQHLSLDAKSTLGESLRRSAAEFDGRQFVSAALHSASGWEKYVHDLSHEIDSNPGRTRSYATTRTLQSAKDGSDEEESGLPLVGLGQTVAKSWAKSQVGDLMNQYGLGGLADTLGLTDPTQTALNTIVMDLGTIKTQLSAIGKDLTSLQGGMANLQSAVADSEYQTIESSIQTDLPGVTDLGGPDDKILQDLSFIAETAQDVAAAQQKLQVVAPTSAVANPSNWCNAEFPVGGPVPAQNDPSRTAYQTCQTITGDLGTGVPAGTGDVSTWCNSNFSSIAITAPLAHAACDVLKRTAQYVEVNDTTAVFQLRDDLLPTGGADGLLKAYNKKLYADLEAQNMPLFGYESFSVPQDAVASRWEGALSILGGYQAAYDAVENPGSTQCVIGYDPTQTTQTNESTVTENTAQCDLDIANWWANVGIPSHLLADIPQNETVDTRSSPGQPALLWQQVQLPCSGQDSNLFIYTCQNDGFGTVSLATTAQLTSFLQGWKNWSPPDGSTPTLTKWLAAGGLPDFSYLGSVAPPSGFGPNGWSGTELSAISMPSCHLVTDKVTGTYNLVTSTGLGGDYWNAQTMGGYFCTVIRMTDNVAMSECVADFPGDIFNDQGCDATYYLTSGQEASTPNGDRYQPGNGKQVPDGPTSYDPSSANYGNHVDYGHGNILFLTTPVAQGTYWYPPPVAAGSS